MRQKVSISFENDNNMIPPNFVIETIKEKSIEITDKVHPNSKSNKTKSRKKTKDKINPSVSIASLLDDKQIHINENNVKTEYKKSKKSAKIQN